VGALAHPSWSAAAGLAVLVAAAAGVWAAVRLRPLGARFTTLAYGTVVLGVGLFATHRAIEGLLAYIVALIGMNVLLYHARMFVPALASARAGDASARRTRGTAVRTLMISGGALLATYGGSLVLLPAVTLGTGFRDPIVALVLALALVLVLLAIAVLPRGPPARGRGSG